MDLNPDPESTWGATDAYKSAWYAQYGDSEEKDKDLADIPSEMEELAAEFVEAGGDKAQLNADVTAAENSA